MSRFRAPQLLIPPQCQNIACTYMCRYIVYTHENSYTCSIHVYTKARGQRSGVTDPSMALASTSRALAPILLLSSPWGEGGWRKEGETEGGGGEKREKEERERRKEKDREE